jgi:hypothetical protein
MSHLYEMFDRSVGSGIEKRLCIRSSGQRSAYFNEFMGTDGANATASNAS